MFENIITNEFKQTFKNAIDALLAQNALTVPCTFKYNNTKKELCFNCEYDAINQKSSGHPKQNALMPFPRGSVCPACRGFGSIDTTSDEQVYLAIIFDSKYWLNWGSQAVNISDGMVQSLSKIDTLPKIKTCKEIIMDTDLSNYDNYRYSLAGEPQPAGLGSHDYIISMWKRS